MNWLYAWHLIWHLISVLTDFIALCSYFICYICLFPVQFIIMYTLFICTSTFSFSYTLIRSLPDDPEFVRPDTGCFMSLIRYWERIISILRSWSSLLIIFSRYFPSLLYSIAFMILCIGLILVLFFYLSVIMCGCLYVTLQWCWFTIVII